MITFPQSNHRRSHPSTSYQLASTAQRRSLPPTDKMGCGMSMEEKQGKLRNEEIENQLKRDKMLQRNEIKMLLLGTCRPLPRKHPSPAHH